MTSSFRYGPGLNTWYVTGDWDGNGTRTPGVIRRVGTGWVFSLRNSTGAGPADIHPFAYGSSELDYPVVGDWDGDGTDTPGVVLTPREATAQLTWQLRNANSAGPPTRTFLFGLRDDLPAVGNWDPVAGGDGIGILRNEHWTWHWRLRQTPDAGGTHYSFLFGPFENIPVLWS